MASDILDRVAMVITDTGAGALTAVTANLLISDRFNTPAEAGAVDGKSYWWMLEEGTDYEIFEGVYTASGTKVARTTVWQSKIAGVHGTAKMTLQGNATLRSITPAEALTHLLKAEVKGGDIASAATVNLETATGDLVDVTGTTAITAITLAEGHERTVRFTGTLTLTNGASLLLPGGANITTAAGDFAVFRGYASGVVRCILYSALNPTNRRSIDGSAKSGANADITGLTNLTGGVTFPTSGAGATFSSGSRVYDGGGNHIEVLAGNQVDFYNAAGASIIATLGALSNRLATVPTIGATNLLLQMSRASNGYIRFWDGAGYTVIQWGLATSASDGGAINFPSTFPNACRQVVAQIDGVPGGSVMYSLAISGITATKFDAYPRFSTGSTPTYFGAAIRYIAIGE